MTTFRMVINGLLSNITFTGFPLCAILGALFFGIVRLFILRSRKKSGREKPDRRHELLLLVFAAFVATVAAYTVLPRVTLGVAAPNFVFFNVDGTKVPDGQFVFHVTFSPRPEGVGGLNLIPLRTIIEFLAPYKGQPSGAMDWNYSRREMLLVTPLLFLPFGLFLPALWEKFQSFKNVMLCTLCVAVAIEVAQYPLNHVGDIDDVILRLAGVALGYGLYCTLKLFRKRKAKAPAPLSADPLST